MLINIMYLCNEQLLWILKHEVIILLYCDYVNITIFLYFIQ